MARKNFFESNNPMFKEENLQARTEVLDSDLVGHGKVMTVENAVNKTFILFGIMLLTALGAYLMANIMLMYAGVFGGMIVYFLASRNPAKASTYGPLYAVCKGLFVGTISVFYATMFDGIVFQAITLTLGVFFTMLMLYKAKIIKVTERFRSIVSTAVGGIMLVYIVEWVLYMFGIDVPFLHDQSAIGIGISLVIVAVASMKLCVDFDNYEKGEQHRMPEYMGWYFGMGLLFTLVWLYSEILYILSAISGD